MDELTIGHLPSLRKQHLLSEFAGLKQACPEGIFVSLTPGDPSLWSAVLFVRNGPYSPAVMRFQMSFPESYPALPPLVLFSTDMFHPLITPLTTYMYTTDIQENGTVSATDDERLPPGGFSLRHGFPEWFGRGRRNTADSRKVSREKTASSPADRTRQGPSGTVNTPESALPNVPSYMQTKKTTVSIYSILKYIGSTFDDEEVLDSIPLNAAGNPGAWHAWGTHRRKTNKVVGNRVVAEPKTAESKPESKPATPPKKGSLSPSKSLSKSPSKESRPTTGPRQPGEWNWDGVWEDRVKKGIASSLSESMLYGPAGGPDELIHFLPMEETDIESVKDNLLRTLGTAV